MALEILTEGKTGYGILIEKDAGITGELVQHTKINEAPDLTEGEVLRIEINCILQKANVKNRNGRIYPKPILDREAKKYQALINTASSFGECVDENTEIFTTTGWKFIKDIAEDEEIYTLNIETNELQKEIIQAKVDREYVGKMYHITNKASIDMMVTPNHNMLIYDRYGKSFSLYAEDFVEKIEFGNLKFKDINFQSEDGSFIGSKGFEINEIDFSGRVYCVKTKNTTWLMRRNGKIAWTHNCNHPETPTISLKREDVSHIIKKIWWEGDTLYGTLEIITSEGYAKTGGIYCIGDFIANLLKRGYKLGISSRGLGSVRTVRGENIVQDDFELVCWDLVSSPSTPDAFLFQETAKTINEDYELYLKNSKKQEKLNKFLKKN